MADVFVCTGAFISPVITKVDLISPGLLYHLKNISVR